MIEIKAVSAVITDALLKSLQATYSMNWYGIHGFEHWCRVRENGLRLAGINGANPKVIEYFAFFHDNQRLSDGRDPMHGSRAAELIRSQFIEHLDLSQADIDLLCDACENHSKGWLEGPLTLQTCWDADRLDLNRVGIMPDRTKMCTDAAREEVVMKWAIERSNAWAQGSSR